MRRRAGPGRRGLRRGEFARAAGEGGVRGDGGSGGGGAVGGGEGVRGGEEMGVVAAMSSGWRLWGDEGSGGCDATAVGGGW